MKMDSSLVEFFLCIFKVYVIFKIIHLFGFFFGIALNYSVFTLLDLIYKYIFKLERLNHFDLTFLKKAKEGSFNVLGVIELDNFDADKIKNLVINKGIRRLKKLRSIVTYKFFTFFWKEVKVEETFDALKIISSKLNDEEELHNYLTNELNNPIDTFSGKVPYEIHLIPYKENKGIFLFKFDHILSDGLGLVSLICTIADNFHVNIFPSVMRRANPGLLKRILSSMWEFISFPIYAFFLIRESYHRTITDNPFNKRPGNHLGKYKFWTSTEYNLDIFKSLREKYSLTVNELIMSVISASIKRFFSEKCNRREISSIFITSPIGQSKIPSNIDEVNLSNNMTGFFGNFPLIDDVKTGCKTVSKFLKKSTNNKAKASALNIFTKLLHSLIAPKILDNLYKNTLEAIDFTCSNIPGPVEELYFNGCKVTSITPIISASKMKALMPIITYNKKLKYVLSFDEVIGLDPRELIDIMEEEMNKLLK